jgi:hypothetical protein
MIKFSSPAALSSRGCVLLGFGLEEGNLVRLLADQPIRVAGAELDVPGADFLIVGGASETQLKERLEKCLSLIPAVGEESVAALHLDGGLIVIPVPHAAGTLYLIGLHDESYRRLRRGQMLNFRARMQNARGELVAADGVNTSIEVLLFWGTDRHKMEAWFREAGLIGRDTRDTRTPESDQS